MDQGITILFIAIVVWVAHRFSHKVVVRLVETLVVQHGDDSKEDEEKREQTLVRIFHGIITVVLWAVTILMILSELGVDIAPLIAGAGVVGIAVGFGGQYLIKDLVTGLFLILENQYRVGDGVEIAGLSGKVEDITLRVTKLRDLDGVIHNIPHGEVTTVSNKTKGFGRINLDIGIAYEANIDAAIAVINKIGQEMAKDLEYKDDIEEAPVFLRVNNLGDSSVDLKVVATVEPGTQFALAGVLRKRIKEAFDKEGIEIPYPHMTITKK